MERSIGPKSEPEGTAYLTSNRGDMMPFTLQTAVGLIHSHATSKITVHSGRKHAFCSIKCHDLLSRKPFKINQNSSYNFPFIYWPFPRFRHEQKE